MSCESNQAASVNEGDQQQMIEEKKPDIFKLDVDCFEEVFNLLSLKDLYAFGLTCKRIKKMAGYHFKLKYPGAIVVWQSSGLYWNGVTINQFNDDIVSLQFDRADIDYFSIIKSNSFKSLKKISLHLVDLTEEKITCLKEILSKIEIVDLCKCNITGDWYARFLQYCKNMKQLSLRDMDFNVEFGCNWLLQHYPKLERLVFNLWNGNRLISELKTFFERNTSVKHLVISEELLWTNRHLIMASNVKLDTLGIWFESHENGEFRDLLIEFRERKTFKWLHLYSNADFEQLIDQIGPIQIEKIECIVPSTHLASLPFVNLKELHLKSLANNTDLETIVGALTHLELVYIMFAQANIIPTFIRLSQKLKHFLMKVLLGLQENVLDLAIWNKEREKSAEVHEVTIYVEEEIVLATKNATILKRSKSNDLNRIFLRTIETNYPDHSLISNCYYSV